MYIGELRKYSMYDQKRFAKMTKMFHHPITQAFLGKNIVFFIIEDFTKKVLKFSPVLISLRQFFPKLQNLA
jgi:hypothetical protein